jgi:hypothetical protein
MKTEEDEAFDELARKQGDWGGGFPAKRRMAADKLQEPAQEPVAWAVQGCSKMWRGEFAEIDAKAEAKRIGGTCFAYALYTTSPKRTWVGLTQKEVQEIHDTYHKRMGPQEFASMLEAKLKEKNNGT